jgi:hypothetical protein
MIISNEDFCKKVIEKFCLKYQEPIHPQNIKYLEAMILESLGGLANLCLGTALCEGRNGFFEAETSHTFASKYISISNVKSEIMCCTGADQESTQMILESMQEVIQDTFREEDITELTLLPIGTFKAIDVDNQRYLHTYEDPARKDYAEFLL